jgi:hypothetical protein
MICEKKAGFPRTAVDYACDAGRTWPELCDIFGSHNAWTYGGESVALKRDGGRNLDWRKKQGRGSREHR